MPYFEVIFWICLFLVVYTYAGYPLLMAVLARLWSAPVAKGTFAGSISIILAAHNEEKAIRGRLMELTQLLESFEHESEILVVSDGSTDKTVEFAEAFSDRGVRVISHKDNIGKAAAISLGAAAARHEILVFADVRQRWADDVLPKLLCNFADLRVGAVSGELMLESQPGVLAGVGIYWRYEKWLRRLESAWHSTVGVTGAICAVRRALFVAVPPGTILDDVYWPLCVTMKGRRVIFEKEAHAFDRLPDKPADEFKRKIRTLSGNFQLLARLPSALLPWRTPVCFPLLSHKVLRLSAPWALLAMLICCLFLSGVFYRCILTVQIYCYLLGFLGIFTESGARFRPAWMAGTFLVLNAAAWLAFWVWLLGRTEHTWHKVDYRTATTPSLSPAAAQPNENNLVSRSG